MDQPDQHFNRARLEKMLHGDPSLIKEILDMFLEDTRENLAGLGLAIRQGDQEVATRTAHALKGSGANIGAERFSSLCYAVEKACSSGHLGDGADQLDLVITEFGELEKTLGDLV